MNIIDALSGLFGVIGQLFDWLEVRTIRDDERRQIKLEALEEKGRLNAQLKAIKNGPDLSRAELFDILCGSNSVRHADDTTTEVVTRYGRVASGSDSTTRMRSGLPTTSTSVPTTGEVE